jgi:hypothetical protein
MSDPNITNPTITDWIIALATCLVPFVIAIVPFVYSRVTQPKIKLSVNVDKSGTDTYYRLRVQNKRRKVARKCVGRLIEIRGIHGEVLDYPQLNFCWERHNQLNLPHPVDIPKSPYAICLDIAKHEAGQKKLRLRVDANDQQLAIGKYDPELRLLTIDAETYYVLISVYTEEGFAESGWYCLEWLGTQYTIKKGKPPKMKL